MSGAAALAEATHRSFPKSEWPANDNSQGQETTSARVDADLFSLFKEELGVTRPDWLSAVWPQEAPPHPQPQLAEQLVEVLYATSLRVPLLPQTVVDTVEEDEAELLSQRSILRRIRDNQWQRVVLGDADAQ